MAQAPEAPSPVWKATATSAKSAPAVAEPLAVLGAAVCSSTQTRRTEAGSMAAAPLTTTAASGWAAWPTYSKSR